MSAPSKKNLIMGSAAAGALLMLAGCGMGGGYGSSTTNSGSNNSNSGSNQGGATISITAPKNNASVTEPFKLTVKSSEALGPTTSGKDHFHLTFDGNAQDYTVETQPTVMISKLAPGKHTIKVTLQHADHSPVGPQAQITVTVTKAGAVTSSSSSASSSGGGYDY
ncbi:hypothetical protein FOE78_14490 [Microlunatus elymi]|uniref:Uncharacterized protein n=2 Tax=Microlunatus elymi TaxID=2596828 RepID=A0A516Q0J3_9ACTN|nr:hypothetical protein FOE78_14490 [Microlunatus elymi]